MKSDEWGYCHSGIPTNLLLIKYCNLKKILLYIQYSNYRMGCGWCGRRVMWWRGLGGVEVLCVKVVMASYGNISQWNPSLMMFKEGDPFYPPFSNFGEVIFFNFDKLLRGFKIDQFFHPLVTICVCWRRLRGYQVCSIWVKIRPTNRKKPSQVIHFTLHHYIIAAVYSRSVLIKTSQTMVWITPSFRIFS